MKKPLLFTIALLGMGIGANAQTITSGSASYSSYFLCEIPGSPKACGYNIYGQLGDGTTTNRFTPVQVQIDAPCGNVGIAEADDHLSGLTIFPNPANNSLTVTSNIEGSYAIELYNSLGQSVLIRTATQKTITLDIEYLVAGIYMITLSDGEKLLRSRVIKE